jgi:hypothetical protein
LYNRVRVLPCFSLTQQEGRHGKRGLAMKRSLMDHLTTSGKLIPKELVDVVDPEWPL